MLLLLRLWLFAYHFLRLLPIIPAYSSQDDICTFMVKYSAMFQKLTNLCNIDQAFEFHYHFWSFLPSVIELTLIRLLLLQLVLFYSLCNFCFFKLITVWENWTKKSSQSFEQKACKIIHCPGPNIHFQPKCEAHM